MVDRGDPVRPLVRRYTYFAVQRSLTAILVDIPGGSDPLLIATATEGENNREPKRRMMSPEGVAPSEISHPAGLPTGKVTFLFTDVEGSTNRWEQHHDAMEAAVARHDVLIRAEI